MMLNMDLIESSSESDDAETLDSLSDTESSSSSSSSLTDSSSSGISDHEGEEEYDRIFNRPSPSSNEETDEAGWVIRKFMNLFVGLAEESSASNENSTRNYVLESVENEPTVNWIKRRNDENLSPEDEPPAKVRRL
jgi:hypothetical protein